MRWGEYTALRRSAVDLDAGIVHVREVLIDDAGIIRRKAIPKSEAGLRTVPLTPRAAEAIRIMIERLDPLSTRSAVEDGLLPAELIFRGPKAGNPRRRGDDAAGTADSVLRRGNFQSRMWVSAIQAAGIARKVRNSETGRLEWWPRVHDYRHAVASRLHAAGVSEADVQAFLGQERGSRVTWLYTHTSDEALGAVRDALAAPAALYVVGSHKNPTPTPRHISDALGATGTEGGHPL